ncbi:beta-lactamase family protein [bacterium]|nr:beta-lactamase family protein [bacterium]
MIEVNEKVINGEIHGYCDPTFESVLTAFIQNFNQREEHGASLCLRIEGETQVDLWGGMADPEGTKPWQRDTISIVFSCTKAAVALCAHILVDRGQLDLNAKVVDYWPEFGQAGKENITVAMLLNHSAGLPAFREPIRKGGYADWDYMIQRLEAEKPFWEPGTRNGYHMISFGWTVGELVRRISGQSLGTFFKENVADPLELDFWIGLPEEQETRVSPMLLYRYAVGDALSEFMQALLHQPDSISALALLNSGGFMANERIYHAAEIGGGGGIANARALAGMYAPLSCDGASNGFELVRKDTITRMSQVSMATQQDLTLLIPTRFALGFMKGVDNRHRLFGNESLIIGEKAFGHAGAGGSLGFADPECRLAFAYTMNRMGEGIMINSRGQSLVDAAYHSLGYTSDQGGVWTR